MIRSAPVSTPAIGLAPALMPSPSAPPKPPRALCVIELPAPESGLIIMMGQQGSGKTTFATKYAHDTGMTLLSRDDFKSKPRLLSTLDSLLRAGKSVIVDATNPTRANRAEFIDIANAHKVPVRIFWATRSGREYNARRPHPVPEVALRTYTARLEPPTPEEGATVHRIN